MNEKRITWREVDHLNYDNLGHGFGLWYQFDKTSTKDIFSGKILVALVHGYDWRHNSKTPTLVEILSPISCEFTGRQLDGGKIVDKAWKLILYFFRENKNPPYEVLFGGHFWARLNM